MAYGTIKVDQVTFTNGGVDQTISVSGIVQSISGDITATGTIQGATIIGTSTVSGATVTGDAGQFITATAATGVFTSTLSGATITGNTASFTTITGGTVTLTSGVFASGTAAAPSVSVGTTDNGLYSPGTDQVAISTSGTGRLFIDSSGRLLVGTSSTIGVGETIQCHNTGGDNFAVGRFSSNAGGGDIALYKSRGAVGTNTVVSDDDSLGLISFRGADGSSYIRAATIEAQVDGTPGANDMPGRLVFSTTADGASTPTEQMRISSDGLIYSVPTYTYTTASAANVNVNAAGLLRRSTSSIKYKTNVETIEDQYADKLLQCRPVWYRSTCKGDCPEHSWWGFIAEEVAEIDPRLVHWKTVEVTYDEKGSAIETPCDPEPEGVAYDRFVPHLLNLIKRQGEAIAELQAEVQALKAQ